MKSILRFSVFGIAALVPLQVAAAPVPPQTAEEILFPSFAVPKMGRLNEAKKLLDEFDTLDQAIPRLSPKEEQWLKSEFDDELARNNGRFTERAAAAMHSREMLIRKAKRRLSEVLPALRDLQNKDLDAMAEIKGWLVVVEFMTDSPTQHAIEELVKKVSSALNLSQDRQRCMPSG